ERLALGDRLDTAERLDAWNMTLWTEVLLGRLEEAAEAAVGARAGLASGQGEGWVAHATAWRISALYWLGRWDEIGPEADRLERAWRQSEIRAPWFALHGLLLALAVAQARGDMTAAVHWREAATTIFRRSDPGVRSRRMESWLTGDLEALERDVVRDWRVFTGRTDYVALALAAMADRAHRADVGVIDTIVAHSEDRSTLLVSSQARRLRGIVRADEADLASALDSFERMRARPFVARVRTELGALRGDPAMVEAGLAELEALGDLEQATRVAARGAPQGGPATI
ncbi:MAG TPA: hypothetical protein VEY67_07145, partial [Candidatus Dormibacteraeota bacterium]|nr:hypothetical protein [Candidatus Dormibacteraeota bacterium]